MNSLQEAQPVETLADRAAQIVRDLRSGGDEIESLTSHVLHALRQRELLPHIWAHIAQALRNWKHADLLEVSAALRDMLADAHADAEPEMLRGIAHCAMTCFDIPTTISALQRIARTGTPNCTDRLLQAACKAATADLPRAIALTTEVLAQEPYNFHALRLRQSWQVALAACRPPWRVPVKGDGKLVLEPLREGHAAMLAWQYRDPAISQKTLLPPIAAPADAIEWIASRAAEQVDAFALVHREHGFVGSCELTTRGEETFFCFWIGTDWQGRGLGRKLARIACRHAFRCGAKIVLTAAYDSNEISLRTLRSNGFSDVALRALDPDHDRTFLYLAEAPMAMSEVRQRLVRFAENANTGLQFPDDGSNRTQD